MNKQFQNNNLALNENYLDNIMFELDFTPEKNSKLNISPLDFKIELEFNEN